MSDIRFIHANDGRVLTIEIGDVSYTPQDIRAALTGVRVRDARIAELEKEIERLKSEVAVSFHPHDYRADAIAYLQRNGYAPGMWARWREEPAPTGDAIEVACVVLDALTQEGVPAWNGDGVGCVSQIILAQIRARGELEKECERLRERGDMFLAKIDASRATLHVEPDVSLADACAAVYAENDRLRADLSAQLQSRAAIVAVQHATTKELSRAEGELERMRAVVIIARRGFGTSEDVAKAEAFDPAALTRAIVAYDDAVEARHP